MNTPTILPSLPASQSEPATRAPPNCAVSPGSAVWDDPHFQLAAEHFGYVPNAKIAVGDMEVRALADFLREQLGEWTVKSADYDRLAEAARWLRSACKDRLPPGHYAKLDEECRAIDAIFSPNTEARERRP
jgi:hypothetical protein